MGIMTCLKKHVTCRVEQEHVCACQGCRASGEEGGVSEEAQ